ncbi:type-F conjugative transfer system pilin assembly protein TrbC [Cupriavidus basilensis]|uniref:Type-F conjugative transfer system pilin assembly protein TrbC n=1 Tax=Cupriavidus basilensis TaxID=68895 RepID=A0ABT6ALK3_9BURK|nr:type-F conjugative transfer system pilin assembly protein TrbC [Cupriavidus basilensis]MDF3833461.1 type-F conjugative transfer system pilin assembly protein TrbC [Cupriavidus basilensis]
MWATDRLPLPSAVVVALLGMATLCLAAPPTQPPSPPTATVTDADIERVRRETPTVTEEDIARARDKYLAPADDKLAPGRSIPKIEALPLPAHGQAIDLEALARGYAAQSDAQAQAQGMAGGPGLFVFVSLAMPPATLQRLFDQAARARATLVIRGLREGSLRATVAQVQALIGQRQVGVQIDPQAFDRFAIQRVPAFVLVREGTRPLSCAAGSCAPDDAYLRTTGDVSLDYALEFMQRSAPTYRKDADVFLRRLRG